MKMMKVFCVMVVYMVVSSSYAEAALSCNDVSSKISACLSYLKQGGEVSPNCCAGVKELNNQAKTTPDRQTTCNCLKTTFKSTKDINPDNAVVLPSKCGVKIPYKISMETDCNNVGAEALRVTTASFSTNKAPFRRYPECFLVLVGLSPYYPFDENTYPAFERPDKTDMGLLDYIRTADPRKVQAVEVQKGEEQVKLLDSIKHCFVSLDTPAVAQQEGGSGSGAGPEVSAPAAEENVVAEEDIVPVGTYLDLTDPEDDLIVAEKGDATRKQPEKAKRKKLSKQSDTLPAKRLRVDHPSLASGTGGKTLASLRRTIPEGSLTLGPSFQADVHAQVTVQSSRVADAPVYTAADTVTSSRGKTHAAPTSDVGGSSQLETSEGSADSFYETAALNSEDAKRWYIPRWNITNDSLLDDGFSCRTLICLESEVRSRTEHELELREKLRAKYDAQGVLLKEKDMKIARLKSLVEEKETESAEVSHLRDRVSVLTAEKSFLSAEVSALKSVVSQKETDISLLDSRATYLKSALDDSQATCTEAKNLISTLSSERDGLASESAFRDFKEKMEAQQEAQAQELYNRVGELEAHMLDVFGCLEGEFYPAYRAALAGRRWLLTHGVQLAMVKCLKSPEYQVILCHALGRAVDFAYNPQTAEANYLDALRALEELDFPLVHLLKSKKDSGMDEVLDCFLLDGTLADLPEAAHLQPCIEQLSVPIYHADVKAVVGETSLSFALLNVHTRAEGAKKHSAALRQLMVDIISHPLSSHNLVGEASTSAATLSVEDLDTDEDLGSVVCMPQFEDPRFEILP
ncbi:gypsy type transposase [Tanacetum coccineum]|uniref:Non-specific lipid-transfer protein n=1 Tax=Tanacetum coccineum TaxID=301880 RepID=A0ABQ4WD12_9ASTR